MHYSIAPKQIFTLGSFVLLMMLVLAVHFSTAQPWLGISLSVNDEKRGLLVTEVDPDGPAAGKLFVGDRLTAIGQRGFQLESGDLLEEPDNYSDYHSYNLFLQRQGLIYSLLTTDSVILTLENHQRVEIQPEMVRPISSLSALFWYQVICGSIVFFAGFSVLAFRAHEIVTIYYAITGLGLLIASFAASVYSTRELAMDAQMLYRLSLLNQFGTMLFAGPFVSILWYYPKRISSFAAGPLLIGFFLVFWVLNFFQVGGNIDLNMRMPILVGLIINLSFAYIQWRRVDQNPLNLAILKWFLLAWLSGTTFYVGLIIVPLMLGYEGILSQSLGWGILVTVYMGITLGITRYKLFHLDRWVINGWYWFVGGVFVLGLDALLIMVIHLDTQLATALSLAITGWIYFPIRQFLMRKLSYYKQSKTSYKNILTDILYSASTLQKDVLNDEWVAMLKKTFSPINIELQTRYVEAAELVDEGCALLVPSLETTQSIRLDFAENGDRLFSMDDCELADSVYLLFNYLQKMRLAFDDGVMQERHRLARDLHDDVAGKMLTLIYMSADEKQADLARETLKNIRDVIHNLENSNHSLQETLDKIHQEMQLRCDNHQIVLLWNVLETGSSMLLDTSHYSNLIHIMREAITNAIKHTPTRLIQVDIKRFKENLLLRVSNQADDAGGFEIDSTGNGVKNIKSRVEELGGDVEWITGKQAVLAGCTVVINIPIGE